MARAKKTSPLHPFDQLHGTETSGLLPGVTIAKGTLAMPAELTAYYGIAPSIFRSLLDTWLQRTAPRAPIEKTVLYDVGAGKGRAMLMASQYPFLRVEGVEFNAELAEVAQRNIATWQDDGHANALAPIVLHQDDAMTHPLPTEPTVVFMFHPFERAMTSRFLRHIDGSRSRTGVPLDLLYANAEYSVLLDRHPAFQHMWTGKIPMSTEDHAADLAEIAQQQDYGSTGDELCAIYRYIGRMD